MEDIPSEGNGRAEKGYRDHGHGEEDNQDNRLGEDVNGDNGRGARGAKRYVPVTTYFPVEDCSSLHVYSVPFFVPCPTPALLQGSEAIGVGSGERGHADISDTGESQTKTKKGRSLDSGLVSKNFPGSI